MNDLIKGDNISDAWLKAISFLLNNNNESYNLIVEIEDPTTEVQQLKYDLDTILVYNSQQRVETVANTIFPIGLYREGNREKLYERFYDLYPRIRQVSSNQSGTYFGRLVAWNYESGDLFNQLEKTIRKLIRAKESRRTIRVMYEMSIYDPKKDQITTMGFPCMSFISIKIREDKIDLTSIYRNQHFVTKAYGNYLGLGRLLTFISENTGFNVGKVTCIATHAELDSSKKAMRTLVESHS
ncbi:hypothetical protein AM500_18375 [Bacillus sp. FJAT-18017]|uniref:thymidylate synthase n=1 Tax=Bacillus sp. FJAT-18017 TaxID=1705566 RepID=UPI0006AE3932|nr:thymidylate synthase [Bacillus sp. FJAT-18017]ALC91530.1 hypothetical protein AM500_18375 [Bacillus sp. FJAT-18017]